MGNRFLIAKYGISFARPFAAPHRPRGNRYHGRLPHHPQRGRNLWINRGEETEPLVLPQPPANECRTPRAALPAIQSVSIAARFLKTLANAERSWPSCEVAPAHRHRRLHRAPRYLQSLVKEGRNPPGPAQRSLRSPRGRRR